MTNPLLDFSDLPLFDKIQPEHVGPAMDELLGKAETALEQVTTPEFPAQWSAISRVLDVATEMQLEKKRQDFGLTLGRWGIGSGPYIVLPLLGSSSVRDTAGFLVDTQFDAVAQTTNIAARNSLTGLRLVDTRARFLGAGDVLDEAALDKYSFARDVYLRRRTALIMGNVELRDAQPEERFDLPENR